MKAQRKFGGMGGHMTAALVHEASFLRMIYQRQINEAYMKRNGGLAVRLGAERDRRLLIIKARMQDRGYYPRNI